MFAKKYASSTYKRFGEKISSTNKEKRRVHLLNFNSLFQFLTQYFRNNLFSIICNNKAFFVCCKQGGGKLDGTISN